MNEQTNSKKKLFSNPIIQSLIGIGIVIIFLGGFIFWDRNDGVISIENSQIEGPIINLSSNTAGTLNEIYVKEGDQISANTPVALVGTNIVSSKQNGIIVKASNNIGAYFVPGNAVVSMIHPEDLKVVGEIDETKGLDKIKIGQKATFTVDAFGDKTFIGIVENIAETSSDSSVVFSISDKRPVKKFDIKIKFNISDYPELKNGMSAKIKIYTK